MTFSARRLGVMASAFYLVLVGVLVAGACWKNDGHFVYALDDPYIHLAMAENLAHGHYGINAHEFSSPSSSVLWPFLLIPLAGTPYHSLVPLVLNVLFGSVAASLLGWLAGGWGAEAGIPGWQQALMAALLVLVGNLASLTVVGMEHVLQVLLAICCAAGMLEALRGRAVPWWSLAAAVLGPSVRYEALALTLAMAIVLAGMRRGKAAVGVIVLAMAPLVAFSIFLTRLGLPVLPLSVMVKGDVAQESDIGGRIWQAVTDCVVDSVTEPERYAMVALFGMVVYLAFTARSRVERFVFGGAAVAGGMQLLIGRFGWFFRYEIYAVMFLTLLCVDALVRRGWFRWWQISLVAGCAACGMIATASTVRASHDVYLQQYQMHRFVTEYYRGSYAVNDLGLTSFERRPGTYVLDVYGLGSLEAARQPVKSRAWLEDVVRRHGTPLMMIYPEWFDEIPASWTEVAEMCLVEPPIALGGQCVAFYSSDPAGNAGLRSALTEFGKTVPRGVVLTLK